MSWQAAVLIIPIPILKKVTRLEVRLCMEDAEGVLNIADVMLQGGWLATIWSGHTSEIKFSFEQ